MIKHLNGQNMLIKVVQEVINVGMKPFFWLNASSKGLVKKLNRQLQKIYLHKLQTVKKKLNTKERNNSVMLLSYELCREKTGFCLGKNKGTDQLGSC